MMCSKKILMAACLCFMAIMLTACPYIDHGTSKAAEFVSKEEIQGCYYGTKYENWYETQVVYCTKFCIDSVAHVQYKLVYANMNADSSFVIEKTYDETEYDSDFSVGNQEKDGSVLYSLYVDKLGSFEKKQMDIWRKEFFKFAPNNL